MQKRLLTTEVVRNPMAHYDDILAGVGGMGKPQEYLNHLIEGIHDGGLTLVMLYDAGAPIGAACYETHTNCNTGESYASQVFMYLKPAYRGEHGLAKRLDDALQTEAKRTGHVRVCYTLPRGEQEPLEALLVKWGYESRLTTYVREL